MPSVTHNICCTESIPVFSNNNHRITLVGLLELELIIQVDGELQLAPGFPAPPNTDYVGYHQYIEDAMPAESPYLYGLHPNAEIGFLTTTSENLFRTIFEMQPRDAQASGATTVTREDKVIYHNYYLHPKCLKVLLFISSKTTE